MQALTNFWVAFAQHYANETAMGGYDLVNEPTPNSMSQYSSWAQTTYNAINAVDPNHVVIIESTDIDGRGTGLPTVTGTNILWSTHCYNSIGTCGFSGTGGSNPLPTKWPMWVGEMGYNGTPGGSTGYVPANLAYYNAHGISWSHFLMHSISNWYGLYQSPTWSQTIGDFSNPWTQMISAVSTAAAGSVFPQ
jgi:hypothetical protein